MPIFFDIKNLFDINDRVGIDIDDKSIKLVQIKNLGKNKKSLINRAGCIPLLKNWVLNGEIINKEEVKKTIKKAFNKFKITSRKIIYTIPEEKVFHLSFLSPSFDRNKINEMVKWEISTNKNRAVEDFYYTWRIVDFFKDEEKYLIDISFVDKKIIKNFEQIFKDLDLKIIGCEFEVNTYSNFFKDYLTKRPLLIVDLSEKKSNLIIYEKGVRMSSSSSFSSGLMTDILSKTLNVSIEEAEKIKRQENLSTVFGSNYFLKTLKPVIDGLLEEIINFENFYYKNFSSKKIEEVLVVGGGAKMKGLINYLTYSLNKKETSFLQNKNILIHKDLNFKNIDLLQYLVAIGTVLN